MLRLILILVATVGAGCACKYAPISQKMAIAITTVWFYLAMDFIAKTLYNKSLIKCLYDNE